MVWQSRVDCHSTLALGLGRTGRIPGMKGWVRMNDSERSQWVDNDEGLYLEWRRSGLAKRAFVRKSRAMLDECIDRMVSGKEPAHFLAYEQRHEY